MRTNLLFVYREYKKDIYDAIKEMSTDFPILNYSNIIIHIRFLHKDLKNSFSSYRNLYGNQLIHEIKLNPLAFLFPNIHNKFENVTGAKYESVKDVIWHELGHSLQIYILLRLHHNLNLKTYTSNAKDIFL